MLILHLQLLMLSPGLQFLTCLPQLKLLLLPRLLLLQLHPLLPVLILHPLLLLLQFHPQPQQICPHQSTKLLLIFPNPTTHQQAHLSPIPHLCTNKPPNKSTLRNAIILFNTTIYHQNVDFFFPPQPLKPGSLVENPPLLLSFSHQEVYLSLIPSPIRPALLLGNTVPGNPSLFQLIQNHHKLLSKLIHNSLTVLLPKLPTKPLPKLLTKLLPNLLTKLLPKPMITCQPSSEHVNTGPPSLANSSHHPHTLKWTKLRFFKPETTGLLCKIRPL